MSDRALTIAALGCLPQQTIVNFIAPGRLSLFDIEQGL